MINNLLIINEAVSSVININLKTFYASNLNIIY